jgi:hypothetical protein
MSYAFPFAFDFQTFYSMLSSQPDLPTRIHSPSRTSLSSSSVPSSKSSVFTLMLYIALMIASNHYPLVLGLPAVLIFPLQPHPFLWSHQIRLLTPALVPMTAVLSQRLSVLTLLLAPPHSLLPPTALMLKPRTASANGPPPMQSRLKWLHTPSFPRPLLTTPTPLSWTVWTPTPKLPMRRVSFVSTSSATTGTFLNPTACQPLPTFSLRLLPPSSDFTVVKQFPYGFPDYAAGTLSTVPLGMVTVSAFTLSAVPLIVAAL